jgi:hypothetical protein
MGMAMSTRTRDASDASEESSPTVLADNENGSLPAGSIVEAGFQRVNR